MKYQTKRDQFVEYDRSYDIGGNFEHGELDCTRKTSHFLHRVVSRTAVEKFENGKRRKDLFDNPTVGPDFIYCMTGRYFCCADNVGSYGSFKAALSSCDPGIYGTHSTRLHTVRTGNITNEVMHSQYNFAPAEFVWTDIKLVNGQKFEAVDCDNNTISIDPAAFAPQYILSVYNFMYSGRFDESEQDGIFIGKWSVLAISRDRQSLPCGTVHIGVSIISDNVASDYLGNLIQTDDKQKYFCFCKDSKR